MTRPVLVKVEAAAYLGEDGQWHGFGEKELKPGGRERVEANGGKWQDAIEGVFEKLGVLS